jgi:hypothetical protein
MARQRRLTAARRAAAEAPVTFVFDVLAADGTDLRTHPYRVRRALLLQLLDDAAPPLAVIPMTTDGKAARAWLTGHLDAGIEGVVAKRLDGGGVATRVLSTSSSAAPVLRTSPYWSRGGAPGLLVSCGRARTRSDRRPRCEISRFSRKQLGGPLPPVWG